MCVASKAKIPVASNYITPNKGKQYKCPSGYKGIPLNDKKQFVNLEFPFFFSYCRILKWLPGHAVNLLKNMCMRFPVIYNRTKDFLNKDNCIMWLGHASFYIRLNGVRILIDPHFNNTFPYFRHTSLVTDPDYFTSIDLILISHDHADHCNAASLKKLFKNNPEAIIIAGLGMSLLLEKWCERKNKIVCLEWYEKFSYNEVNIFFVPAQHYSKRIFKPFCRTLWGGFIIESNNDLKCSIYFAGDSGYAGHFKDIGTVFKPDIAIMGIGAYAPEWFMKANHISPKETYKAFIDSGACKLIPMHFQTFNLSNEPMREPLQKLYKIADPDKLAVLKQGIITSLKSILKLPHQV